MLITFTYRSTVRRRLLLEVSTFNAPELGLFEDYLQSQSINYGVTRQPGVGTPRANFRADYAMDQGDAAQFETAVGVSFSANAFVLQPLAGSGQYACSEVTARGGGSGCEEFTASNDMQARIRCGLIAGRRGWLGGSASPGKCSAKGSTGGNFGGGNYQVEEKRYTYNTNNG